MDDPLGAAIRRYLDLARSECDWARGKFQESLAETRSHDAGSLLRLSIDRAEDSPEFRAVLSAVAAGDSLGPLSRDPLELLKDRVAVFFRRSRTYQRMFSEVQGSRDGGDLFSAFGKKEREVRYLAPIEFLRLSTDLVDLGDFQIRRFDAAELDQIFSNDVNEVFFPYAWTDSTLLERYWFLDIHCKEGITSIWKEEIHINAPYPLHFSSHPSEVHAAIRHLALRDWQGDVWTRAPHPKVPFVIRVSDDLTEWPSDSPDLEKLEVDWMYEEHVGKDVCRRPAAGFDLDEIQTEHLRDSLRDTCGIVSGCVVEQNAGDFRRPHWTS